MSGNLWREEQLVTGANAYFIPRKLDTERPLIIHFGLREVQLAVCGLCLCAKLFKLENNVQDVAQWCVRHWRTYSTPHEGIEVHDKSKCYSECVLARMLRDSIAATSTRQSLRADASERPRSILLSKAWLTEVIGLSAINSMMNNNHPTPGPKHITKVCNKCLRESPIGGCCPSNETISVVRLQAGKCMEPLFCTNNAALLAHEAIVLGKLMVPPPPPQITSPAPTGTSLALTYHHPVTSVPNMTPASSTSPVSMFTTSQSSPIPFSLGVSPTTTTTTTMTINPILQNLIGQERVHLSLVTVDLSLVDERKASVNQSGGVCPLEGTKRNKKGHDRDDPERDLLYKFRFTKGRPSPETIKRYAKAHTYDKTICEDVLLMEISGCVLDRLLGGLSAVQDTIILITASRLPKIAGYATDIRGMNDMDPRVLSLREFDPSRATYKRRKRALFGLLKTMMVLPEVEGHYEIKKAYQKIEELCNKRKLDRNMSTLVQALDSLWKESEGDDCDIVFGCVGLMIGMLEYCIRADESQCWILLQVLVFGPERERARYSPPRLTDDDDDEELDDQAEAEAELEAEDDASSPTQQTVEVPIGVRTPREVSGDLGDALSIFKYTSVYPMAVEQRKRDADRRQFYELLEQNMEHAPEGQAIAAKQQCLQSLLRLYYDRYEKTSFTASLAKLIADLNRMQGLSTNLVNVWQLDAGDFGPVFANGVMRVDFRLLRKGFQKLVRLLEKELFTMLLPVLPAGDTVTLGPSSTVNGPSTQQDEGESDLLTRFHGTDYYKALFTEPSVDRLVVHVDSSSAYPHLDPSDGDPVAEHLLQDLKEAFQADKIGFLSGAEQFRKYVLSLVDMLGSSTLRTLDLLDIHRGLNTIRPGNIIGYKTENGEYGLLIMKFVQKTGVEGMSFVPPFAGRFLLVLLDLIAPLFASKLAEDLLSLIPADLSTDQPLGLTEICSRGLRSYADADYDRIASGPREVIKTWRTATRLQLDETGKVLTGFRDQDGDLPPEVLGSLQLDERVLVGRLSDQKGRLLVRDGVCGDALDLPDMDLWRKRSLFVNFRFHMPEYLETMERVVKVDNVHAAIGELRKGLKSCGTLWQSLSQGRVTGQHSAQTQLSSYSDGTIIYASSGEQVKVPGLLLTTNLLHGKMHSLVYGVAAAVDGQEEVDTIHSGIRSLNRTDRTLRDMLGTREDAVETQLCSGLRKMFPHGNGEFISNTQKESMMMMMKGSSGLIIADLCGGGKTLTVALPYSLLRSGGKIVVVVCPFRAVLDCHFATFQALGIRCKKYDAGDPWFLPQSFTNGTVNNDGASTIVLAVTEAFQKPSFCDFLFAADYLNHLACIAVDEAHQLVLSADFRPAMKKVTSTIGALRARLILLSGTLPAEIKGELIMRFGLVEKVIHTIENKTARLMKGRRVVSAELLASRNDVDKATFGVLENWTIRNETGSSGTPPPARVAMVFCLTKEIARGLEHDITIQPSTTRVLQVDSETPEERRIQIMRELKCPTKSNTILFGTSGFGEGVDVPLCDLVVIHLGTHRGWIEFVQMASRVGRGPPKTSGGRLPEVFFFCELNAWRNTLGHQEGKQGNFHQSDANVVKLLTKESQSTGRDILGAVSMLKLFQDDAGKDCVTLGVERAYMRNSQLQGTCKACNRCLGMEGQVHDLLSNINVHRMQEPGLKMFLKTDEKQAGPSATKPTSQEDVEVGHARVTRITNKVRKFLSENRGACPLCSPQTQHYPNMCPKLNELRARATWCFQCYGSHKIVKNAFATGRVLTEPEKTILAQCAYVTDDDVEWRNHKPCSFCWLAHGDRCERGDHTVRAMAISVFYFPHRRGAFLTYVGASGVPDISTSWRVFFRWLVYEGEGRLQNAYRLVDWYMENPMKES